MLTPDQVQAALAQYQTQMPLSSPSGTWAAPNTAPLDGVPGTVDTTALTPEAPAQPDWMAAARQYAQPVPAQPAMSVSEVAPLSMPAAAHEQALQQSNEPAQVQAPQTPQDALRQYAQANATEAQAAREKANQLAQAHEAEAVQANTQAAGLDVAMDMARRQESLRQTHLNDLLAKSQKANQEAENMRIVDRRTTAQVVTGAIAQAGAAIADGFKAMGGNYNGDHFKRVTDQLERQFQQDIELQREAISDKRKAAAAYLSELGVARQLGLDEKSTEQYATGLLMQKHAQAAKALSAQTQSADAKTTGDQLAAHLETQGAQYMNEALERGARDKANQDYLKEQSAHLRRMDARAGTGGAGNGATPSVSFDAIRAKIAGGQELSPDELKAASTSAYRDWSKGTKTGGAEIIPGYAQDESTTSLTQGEINDVRKQYRAAKGVEWLSNRLADLWEVAVDPASTDEARKAARSEYDGVRNDLLSGKSVQTGQGTITEGDAKRTGGAIPELPTNWLGSVRTVQNFVKGNDPGAASIRAVGSNAVEQMDAQLADTYGVRRRQQPRAEVQGPGAPDAPLGPPPRSGGQVQRATSAADLD